MNSNTDRWTSTYYCPCGQGTITEECSQYCNTFSLGPINRTTTIDCPACAARYALLDKHLAGKAENERHNRAQADLHRAEMALFRRRRELAKALAQQIATPLKSLAAECRHLAATYGSRTSYATYVRDRKKHSWPDMLALHLYTDPRVASGIEPELISAANLAKAQAQAAEIAWRATFQPFTLREKPDA